ncbi:hypothetical protein L1049_014315 [Liquidambar formosana]|uniref:Aminotransferase-like plant mobile domain-containing protein n=1 Tax=Liquidambar formosana TaxID=63359 RepID=A0AAP0RMT8_LIQFO
MWSQQSPRGSYSRRLATHPTRRSCDNPPRDGTGILDIKGVPLKRGILEEVDASLKADKGESTLVAPLSHDLLLPREEAQVDDGVPVADGATLRFCIERGDCPESDILYASHSQVGAGWQDWVVHLLSSAIVKDKLTNASVANISLTKQEKEAKTALKEALLASSKLKSVHGKKGSNLARKANFASWIRLWWKDYPKKSKSGKPVNGPCFGQKYSLEAFLSYWLSRYVLEGAPEDGVNAWVFPLTIKITKGEQFALAPVFLGSLYRHIDLIKTDMERSMH